MKINRSATWSLALAVAVLMLPAWAAETETETTDEARPRIEIEEPVADVGIVIKGESVSHVFEIRNSGSEPLEILEVRPACGCTVVDYDKTIAPGATGKLSATLDTAGLRSGGGSKSISVFTNDPDFPRINLTMQAKLRDYLIFNPGFARFVKGKGHEPGEVTQIFYAPKFDGLEITSIESPWPFLTVDHRLATPDERRPEGALQQHVLTLKLDYDKATVGPLTGKLVVNTNHPKQKTAWLNVSGFVRPLMAVTPAKAEYGEFEKPEAMTTNFLVKSFAPFPIKVTKVEKDVPGTKVVITPLEEGKSYNVELSFDPKMPKGPFSGHLKIHTDSPKAPLVEVELSGTVL